MRANGAAATEPPPPACPYCGEREPEALSGRVWFCPTCSKTFVTPPRRPPGRSAVSSPRPT
jgi:ribosomal protein L37AE/L43A